MERHNIEIARGSGMSGLAEKTSRGYRGHEHREADRLPDSEFAFTRERKEPIHDAAHVRNAIARFDQVEGVTDQERDDAWRRIRAAAKKYDIDMREDDWREIFRRHPGKPKR
jgi:hypothetical protein